MMTDTEKTVSTIVKAYLAGQLTTEQIVAWADHQIIKTMQPEAYLFHFSLLDCYDTKNLHAYFDYNPSHVYVRFDFYCLWSKYQTNKLTIEAICADIANTFYYANHFQLPDTLSRFEKDFLYLCISYDGQIDYYLSADEYQDFARQLLHFLSYYQHFSLENYRIWHLLDKLY